MAAPTTTHSVTVRKLSSMITSLWTKMKNTFAPKTDNGSTGTAKFYREDGTWAAPGSSSFAYEHTNEINARNVPSNPRHWFNYRDGDTASASPDNLITDYYFGNRNNKVDGVNLNADGIISPTRKNSGRMHFCIKITRMNTTENDFATVRVPFSSQNSEENFGYVEIIIKFRTNDWNARAFVFARGAYSKLGQAFYLQNNPNSVGGTCYIAIDITDANVDIRFSPIVICHGTSANETANRAMKIEFGDFTPSGSPSALQTRWPAFIDYNNNSHSAVGSSAQPVYADGNGVITSCTNKLPTVIVPSNNEWPYNLYSKLSSYNNGDVVNILNLSGANSKKVQMTSSSSSDLAEINNNYFRSFVKYGSRWYVEY